MAEHTHEPLRSTVDGLVPAPPGRYPVDAATALARAVGNRAFDHAVGPGRPLDENLRHAMEARFGADFAAVRVHSGDAAGRSADAFDANAYTIGTHIVLNRGADTATLAHELAHVVQQRGTGPAGGASLEADADRAAADATAGRAAIVTGRAAPGLARAPKSTGPAEARYEYVAEDGQRKQVTASELAALRTEATNRLRGKLRRVRDLAETNRSTHQWFLKDVHGQAESLGDLWRDPKAVIGIAVDIRSGVVPPPVSIWDQAVRFTNDGDQALVAGDLRAAAHLLGLADAGYRESVAKWNGYLDKIQEGGKKLVGELEIVRDVSFAIAITAAVIVAAPVVATAVGATGALATGATALGTGVVGAATGAGLRGSADVLAQQVVTGRVDLSAATAEAKRGAREGFVTGITAGAVKGLGGVSSGGGTVARQFARRAAVEGGTNALGQATDAALSGKSAREVAEAGAVGFGTGVITAPLGAAGQRLSAAGRAKAAKAVELGGTAAIAGGATLAAGGDLREAAKNAGIAVAGAGALSGATPTKRAPATPETPPTKQPPATTEPATTEPAAPKTIPPEAPVTPPSTVERPRTTIPQSTVERPVAAVPEAAPVRPAAPPQVAAAGPAPEVETTPPVVTPPATERPTVTRQRDVVARRQKSAAAAQERAREAAEQRDLAMGAAAAAEQRLAAARAARDEAAATAASAADVYARAQPGARRAPRSADTQARAALRGAEETVTTEEKRLDRAENDAAAATRTAERQAVRAGKRANELKVSEAHLERKLAATGTEAPRQQRAAPFDPRNRRPDLSQYRDMPGEGVERHEGLRREPQKRVSVQHHAVRSDLKAEHEALIAELRADKDKAQELGHIYEKLVAEDITRGGGGLRLRTHAGDKPRVSDHGVHEFTLEKDLSPDKLDQLWRDLLTPTPGSATPRDHALLTVPKLSEGSAKQLSRMAAAYEDLTGRRPTIIVRETAK